MAKGSRLTPDQIAAKWQRNSAAAGESIRAGVQAVQVSPMAQAAARQDAYLAGVQRAVSEGRWQAGLQRRSLQDWQQAVITKGIPRHAQGVSGATPKVTAFFSQFLPHIQQVVASLPPRGSLEENLARANQMARGLAQFKMGRGAYGM